MRNSRIKQKSTTVHDWTERHLKSTNMQFFADALGALSRENTGNGGLMVIGLLGQRDLPGVTVRQAQSVLRWDLRPSLWSHVFLIAEPVIARSRTLSETRILEVTLHARTGEFPRPEKNGVTEGRLGLYDNPFVDANAALLAVSMTDKEVQKVSERATDYNVDRLRYNLWETLGVWQAYLWANGARPNPLRDGFPVFSSSYAEMVFEAIQFDLSPGASERNSAPEHIWNTALWWHEVLREQKRQITGYYVARDKGCALMDSDVHQTTPPRSGSSERSARQTKPPRKKRK